MYKLREERLRNFYCANEPGSDMHKAQSTPGLNEKGIKEGNALTHADSLGDHSFLSLKSKEIRDSESPTRDVAYRISNKSFPSPNWDIVNKSETSNDGKTHSISRIATTSGKENITGGVTDYAAQCEQTASVYADGDDNNYTKSATATSRGVLKQSATIKDDNSETQTFSTSTNSASKVVTEKHYSNTDYQATPRDFDNSTSGAIVRKTYTTNVPNEFKNHPHYVEGNTKVTTETRVMPDGTKVTTTRYETKGLGKVSSEEYNTSKQQKFSTVTSSSRNVEQHNVQDSNRYQIEESNSSPQDSNTVITMKVYKLNNDDNIGDKTVTKTTSSTTKVQQNRVVDSKVSDRIEKNYIQNKDDVRNIRIIQENEYLPKNEPQPSVTRKETLSSEINTRRLYDSPNMEPDTRETRYDSTQTVNTSTINQIKYVTEENKGNKDVRVYKEDHPIQQLQPLSNTTKDTWDSKEVRQNVQQYKTTIDNKEHIHLNPVKPEERNITYEIPVDHGNTPSRQIHPQEVQKLRKINPEGSEPEGSRVTTTKTTITTKTVDESDACPKRQDIVKQVNSSTYKTDYTSKRVSVDISPTHDAFARSLRAASPDHDQKPGSRSSSSLRRSATPDKHTYDVKHQLGKEPNKKSSLPNENEIHPRRHSPSKQDRIVPETDKPRQNHPNNDGVDFYNIQTSQKSTHTLTATKTHTSTASPIKQIRDSPEKRPKDYVKEKRPTSLGVTSTITTKTTKKIKDRSPTSPLTPTKDKPQDKPLKRRDTYEERCRQILGIDKTTDDKNPEKPKQILRSPTKDKQEVNVRNTEQFYRKTEDHVRKLPEKTVEHTPQKDRKPNKNVPEKQKISEYPSQVRPSHDKSPTYTTSTQHQVDITINKKLSPRENQTVDGLSEYPSQTRRSPDKQSPVRQKQESRGYSPDIKCVPNEDDKHPHREVSPSFKPTTPYKERPATQNCSPRESPERKPLPQETTRRQSKTEVFSSETRRTSETQSVHNKKPDLIPQKNRTSPDKYPSVTQTGLTKKRPEISEYPAQSKTTKKPTPIKEKTPDFRPLTETSPTRDLHHSKHHSTHTQIRQTESIDNQSRPNSKLPKTVAPKSYPDNYSSSVEDENEVIDNLVDFYTEQTQRHYENTENQQKNYKGDHIAETERRECKQTVVADYEDLLDNEWSPERQHSKPDDYRPKTNVTTEVSINVVNKSHQPHKPQAYPSQTPDKYHQTSPIEKDKFNKNTPRHSQLHKTALVPEEIITITANERKPQRPQECISEEQHSFDFYKSQTNEHNTNVSSNTFDSSTISRRPSNQPSKSPKEEVKNQRNKTVDINTKKTTYEQTYPRRSKYSPEKYPSDNLPEQVPVAEEGSAFVPLKPVHTGEEPSHYDQYPYDEDLYGPNYNKNKKEIQTIAKTERITKTNIYPGKENQSPRDVSPEKHILKQPAFKHDNTTKVPDVKKLPEVTIPSRKQPGIQEHPSQVRHSPDKSPVRHTPENSYINQPSQEKSPVRLSPEKSLRRLSPEKATEKTQIKQSPERSPIRQSPEKTSVSQSPVKTTSSKYSHIETTKETKNKSFETKPVEKTQPKPGRKLPDTLAQREVIQGVTEVHTYRQNISKPVVDNSPKIPENKKDVCEKPTDKKRPLRTSPVKDTPTKNLPIDKTRTQTQESLQIVKQVTKQDKPETYLIEENIEEKNILPLEGTPQINEPVCTKKFISNLCREEEIQRQPLPNLDNVHKTIRKDSPEKAINVAFITNERRDTNDLYTVDTEEKVSVPRRLNETYVDDVHYTEGIVINREPITKLSPTKKIGVTLKPIHDKPSKPKEVPREERTITTDKTDKRTTPIPNAPKGDVKRYPQSPQRSDVRTTTTVSRTAQSTVETNSQPKLVPRNNQTRHPDDNLNEKIVRYTTVVDEEVTQYNGHTPTKKVNQSKPVPKRVSPEKVPPKSSVISKSNIQEPHKGPVTTSRNVHTTKTVSVMQHTPALRQPNTKKTQINETKVKSKIQESKNGYNTQQTETTQTSKPIRDQPDSVRKHRVTATMNVSPKTIGKTQKKTQLSPQRKTILDDSEIDSDNEETYIESSQNVVTTKSVLINNDINDDRNVIITLQRSISSREPTPNRICPQPTSDEEDYGTERYPDEISEPNEYVRKPFYIHGPNSEPNIDRQTHKTRVDRVDDTDESLLTVTQKVSKFINEAEKLTKTEQNSTDITRTNQFVSKPGDTKSFKTPEYLSTNDIPPRPKSPRCENYPLNAPDKPYTPVSERVTQFIKTAENVSYLPKPKPERVSANVKEPQYVRTDTVQKNNDRCTSVADKINKFSTPQADKEPIKPVSLSKLDKIPARVVEDYQETETEAKTYVRNISPTRIPQNLVSPTKPSENKSNIPKKNQLHEFDVSPKTIPKEEETKHILSTTSRLRSTETVRKAKELFESNTKLGKETDSVTKEKVVKKLTYPSNDVPLQGEPGYSKPLDRSSKTTDHVGKLAVHEVYQTDKVIRQFEEPDYRKPGTKSPLPRDNQIRYNDNVSTPKIHPHGEEPDYMKPLDKNSTPYDHHQSHFDEKHTHEVYKVTRTYEEEPHYMKPLDRGLRPQDQKHETQTREEEPGYLNPSDTSSITHDQDHSRYLERQTTYEVHKVTRPHENEPSYMKPLDRTLRTQEDNQSHHDHTLTTTHKTHVTRRPEEEPRYMKPLDRTSHDHDHAHSDQRKPTYESHKPTRAQEEEPRYMKPLDRSSKSHDYDHSHFDQRKTTHETTRSYEEERHYMKPLDRTSHDHDHTHSDQKKPAYESYKPTQTQEEEPRYMKPLDRSLKPHEDDHVDRKTAHESHKTTWSHEEERHYMKPLDRSSKHDHDECHHDDQKTTHESHRVTRLYEQEPGYMKPLDRNSRPHEHTPSGYDKTISTRDISTESQTLEKEPRYRDSRSREHYSATHADRHSETRSPEPRDSSLEGVPHYMWPLNRSSRDHLNEHERSPSRSHVDTPDSQTRKISRGSTPDKHIPGYMKPLDRNTNQPKPSKFEISTNVTKTQQQSKRLSSVEIKELLEKSEYDDIYDLELLEILLENATNYEQRRKIRAQIRIVKQNSVECVHTTIKEISRTGEINKPTPKSKNLDNNEHIHSKETRQTQYQTTYKNQSQYISTSKHETQQEKIVKTQSSATQERLPNKTKKELPKRSDDEKPSWVNQRNLKKVSETPVKLSPTTRKQTVSKSSQPKNSEPTAVITSGYGVGPTDENGSPLFGLRALRVQNQTESKKVQGTVIQSHYYSKNGQEPVGEVRVTKYSSDPRDLEGHVDKNSDGLVSVTTIQKIGPQGTRRKEITDQQIIDLNDEEYEASGKTTSQVVRRNSVKEMSKKFIENAVETSKTEKSYPKAGLILRTSSFKDTGKTKTKKESSPEKQDTVRTVTVTKTVTSSEKGGKVNTFLTNKTRVQGVQDTITRMKNSEQDVQIGDSQEDVEARALLNKFIGSQVILSGMETRSSSTPSGSSSFKRTTTTTTTTSTGNEKPTVITRTFTHPITEEDLNNVWDEETLNLLLERSTEYTERQIIRERLHKIMAEQEVCANTVQQTKDESSGRVEEVETSKTTITEGPVTTNKVTTRVTSQQVTKKPLSPFAKFRQLDKQNSLNSPGTPRTPTGSGPLFKFTDPELSRQASTVKERLLQWCQMKTKEYENVQLDNFSSSWSDGLAFCALIHHFLPDAFDYHALTSQERQHNFELAFRIASEKANIAPLLDVEDMIATRRPDWKCVFTYVQTIYARFKNED